MNTIFTTSTSDERGYGNVHSCQEGVEGNSPSYSLRVDSSALVEGEGLVYKGFTT